LLPEVVEPLEIGGMVVVLAHHYRVEIVQEIVLVDLGDHPAQGLVEMDLINLVEEEVVVEVAPAPGHRRVVEEMLEQIKFLHQHHLEPILDIMDQVLPQQILAIPIGLRELEREHLVLPLHHRVETGRLSFILHLNLFK
jgi:hypothetical protein